MTRYTPDLARRIEARWQQHWEEHRTFHVETDTADGPERPAGRYYVLDMFIGPSGVMHVGHPLGYVGTDVIARFKRMRGFDVMHAFGYDAFGLPPEQYAVRTGRHPAQTTAESIATITGQLRRLGLGHDPRRSVSTTDVSFYRWTQWMFLRLFDSWYDHDRRRARPIAELPAEVRADPEAVAAHRLAYLSEQTVNWCPGLGTVLANEEVTDEGRSVQGNFPVYQRKLQQWMLRITAYADRLTDDLDGLDWPEPIKAQQLNWIPGMRDWLFSRQRYWGEPIPIVYPDRGDGTGPAPDAQPVALPEEMVPVELPEIADFSPAAYDPEDAQSTPMPPLARLPEWGRVELDLGDGTRVYWRETNTMPQWAGSCWYFLRYLDPDNDTAFCAPEHERAWMPVDLYVGGVEHAVLHLLYARFWHKVLYDLGYVSTAEPFSRLVNNGHIQAYAYTDRRGITVQANEVVERDGQYFHNGEPVRRSLGKMGKSLGNMVTPDEICDTYGADTFRVAIMASGPLTVSRPWTPDALTGAQRFCQRVWRMVVDEQTGEVRASKTAPTDAERRLLHQAIAVVGDDTEQLAFNTAIARLTEFVKELQRRFGAVGPVPRELIDSLVLMTAPFAPHMAEELWSRLGNPESLAFESFPQADPMYLTVEQVTCVVQVDGKVRERIEVPADIADDVLAERARALPKVEAAIVGSPVRRTVTVPPRLVNFVTK